MFDVAPSEFFIVALVALVDGLADEYAADRLLDVQWLTPHLASLGAVEVSRATYLHRLARALPVGPPHLFPPVR